MADPAEFAPAELDRIEDALEFLEHDLAGDESSYAVRQRLGDYRRIAVLSRTALPMIDPPRRVLDDVLAAAREACEVPSLAPHVAEPARPVQEGFWSRMRRFAVLPGVALAGTAALVLVMVQQRDAPTIQSAAPAPVADDARPTTRERSELAESDAMPAARTVAPSPGAAPPPAAATPAPVDAPVVGLLRNAEEERSRPAEPAPDPDGKLEQAAGEKSSDDKAKPAIGSGGAPAKNTEVVTPRWDIIVRGDRARHKGDCDEAASEYRLALDDPDAFVRARAHAGLGLCDAAEGDASSAEAAYKVAHALDPEIAGFIEGERPRGAGASTGVRAARSKKAKPKAAAKVQSDAYNDPD